MKRPLTGCCILFLIFILVMQTAESQPQDFPLFQTEEILMEQFGEENPVTVSGVVTQCSTLSSGLRLFVDHLTFYSEDNSEISILPKTKITFITEQSDIRPGDFVQVRGFCTFFSVASNPGQFDERAYYFSKDTVCSLKQTEILQQNSGQISFYGLLYQIRCTLSEAYNGILDEQTAGTISAITLGDKGAMDTEWKSLFQAGGIAHILAVSGLHITMIGAFLYRMTRKIGLPIPGAAVLSGAVVLLYALMTGFGVSAVRASLMFLIWLGAQIAGRKYDMITAAAVAAAVILGCDADSVKEASFLLSFSAVLSLAVLLPVGETACGIESSAGKSLFSCMIVWIGTLPVTLYFFYQTAPWSIVVNLAVVPLMSIVMAAGLGAAALSMISVPLGMFAAAPVHYLLYLFEWLCQLEKKLPFAVWITGRPGRARILLYYVVLLILLVGSLYACRRRERNGNRRKKAALHGKELFWKNLRDSAGMRMFWLGGLILCILLMVPPSVRELQVTCLDVGQGDGALLRLPGGENCLIDGGSSSVSKVWQYRMEDAVKYYGIDTLDYVFLSHADQDHISGIKEFLENCEPGFGGYSCSGITLKNLILPPTADAEDFAELTALAAENGVRVLTMQRGASIQGESGWSIECLAPNKSSLTGDKNEDSMVLMLKYGQFRMLFTGDLEGNAEQQLAASGADLQADVLKVGHHGSKNGSSEAFLQQVQPEFAVISCGEGNSYGHPAEEIVQRLEAAGCEILQTPKKGAVTICSDGKGYSVETYLRP